MNHPKALRTLSFPVFLLILNLSGCSNKLEESSRITESFNTNWKFLLSSGDYSGIDVDDSNWRVLNLPHDWSIEGEFDMNNPAGVGGGALPGGRGWYRKYFRLPESDSGKRISILFDGIYWNSEVFVNGRSVGKRPNGYISFSYDISSILKFGDQENVISVRVDNSQQPNSRWYSGSGIYRNTWLVKTSPVHIGTWGISVSTPKVSRGEARVAAEALLMNGSDLNCSAEIRFSVLAPSGEKTGSATASAWIEADGRISIPAEIVIRNPLFWSVDTPQLYILRTEVYVDGEKVDEVSTRFGIRTFKFDPEKGFFLNGESLKILGVCNHHDLGCLGTAVNRRAIQRQLELLKEMGCNAIRTSHNPPAPELLDLCDEMGFLVMDETFDMWKKKKSTYDYSQFWGEWHERDLRDHILRDRNHPSVFMWSIGNEILEQWDSTGTTMTHELAAIVRSLDTSRQIVTGNNFPSPENAILKADEMEIIGYNYRQKEYKDFPKIFPGKCFLATETTSGLMTRGVYDMPSDSIRRWPKRWDRPFLGGNPDNTVSSYDNVSAPWGSTHEESWREIKKYDFLSGMFIWTGFDYLGEPTPYGWPSRSSYFGIIDLAGFPKDVYYMYKSEWTDEPVLHLFPHWNWKKGEVVDVLAYTNCKEVELFLNGKSMGSRVKNDSVFHLLWRLEYEPGELKAVGIFQDGTALETIVKTAGEAYKIRAQADRSILAADGSDLSFITISVLDSEGNIVPDAGNLISCEIEGDAKLVGTDNGNQVSHKSFKTNFRKAYNGKCLFVIQSGEKTGSASIRFSSDGLKGDETLLEIR